MQEAVEAVTSILGMAASEGSDAVPPNARSHTLLLAGKLIGDAQVRSTILTDSGAADQRGLEQDEDQYTT